jgi:hypothetical protein
MSCAEVLEFLLEHGTWFTTAIELDGGALGGKELRVEAQRAVAAARTLTVVSHSDPAKPVTRS